MSDEKLKEAMAEVVGVMQKHDLGGFVVLVSPERAEFRLRLDTGWSCIRFVEDNRVKIEIRKENFKKVEHSMHLMYQIRDLCVMGIEVVSELIDSVIRSGKVRVEHEPYKGFDPSFKH